MPGEARQHFSTAAVPPCQHAALRAACQLVSLSTEGEEMTCLKERFVKE